VTKSGANLPKVVRIGKMLCQNVTVGGTDGYGKKRLVSRRIRELGSLCFQGELIAVTIYEESGYDEHAWRTVQSPGGAKGRFYCQKVPK
jgi:hypothetical protein